MAFLHTRAFSRSLGATLLVVIATTAAWMIWLSPSTAQTAEAEKADEASVLDVRTYLQVKAVREQLLLTDLDLAAAGVTGPQAEAVLGQVLAWHNSRAKEIDQRESAVRQARAALRDVHRRIAMGPRDKSLLGKLPGLAESRDAAEGNKKLLMDSLVTQLQPLLTAPQREVLATARANEEVAGLRRYVRVYSEQERESLDREAVRRSREIKPESGKIGGISTTKSQLTPALEQDKAAAVQVDARVRSSMPAVTAASAKVLPIPLELLQPEPEGGEGLLEAEIKAFD